MKKEVNINKGHRERLRERFFSVGLDGFEPHEVIELLLFNAYPYIDTKDKAKSVLNHFDNDLHKLLNANKEELMSAGMTTNAASLIKLTREVFIYQMRQKLLKERTLKTTTDASNYLKAYFKGKQREEFLVIYLDGDNNINATKSEFKGSVKTAKIYVRELIKKCLNYNAASIIIAHNHPSGSLQPTQEDINTTNKIILALDFLEIRLLDHILVGDNETYSFADNGLL